MITIAPPAPPIIHWVAAAALLCVQNLSDVSQDPAMSMPTSSSMGQLVSSRRGGEQHETIAEEDGGALSTDGEEETRDAGEDRDSNSTHGHRRDNATRGIHLMTLHIDKVPESALGVTGQVSPASERAGRPSASGSVSPGRLVDNRYVLLMQDFTPRQHIFATRFVLNTRTCNL